LLWRRRQRRGRRWIDGDEDVADFDLRIDAVELLILAVVLLDIRFGDLRFAAGEVGIGDVDVLDFAGLRVGVHVARGVFGCRKPEARRRWG